MLMSLRPNLTNQTFDRLTVVGRSLLRIPASGRKARERGWTRLLWECRCACGTTGVLSTTTRLLRGNTRSCGCLQREKAAASLRATAAVRTPKTCLYCRTEFLGTAKQLYCCTDHKWAAQIVTRDDRCCEICREPLRARVNQRYCSDRCRSIGGRSAPFADQAVALQLRVDHDTE